MSSSPILEVPGVVDAVEIGAGGFGTVFRALQPALDRTVAVKVLHDTVGDERIRRRFEREARAMGKLSGHPNIVVVHEGGVTASGHPYIVMAYEDGGSLDDRIASGGPLPWPDVAEIGVRLSGALQTAHDAGILHRDLKPANVLVNAYGDVRLGDFGIARLSGTAATTTNAGVTASIAHAPPEVLDGADPTGASDVYSLASTLHTMLRGAPPFLRDTDQSIIQLIGRLVTEDPPPLPSDVPAPIASVILSGLTKNPDDRPSTAAGFGRLLQDAQRSVGRAPTALPVRTVDIPLGPDDEQEPAGLGVADDRGRTSAVATGWAPPPPPTVTQQAPAPPASPPPGGVTPPVGHGPSHGSSESASRSKVVAAVAGLVGLLFIGVVALALIGDDETPEDTASVPPSAAVADGNDSATGSRADPGLADPAIPPSEVGEQSAAELTGETDQPAWLSTLPGIAYLSSGGDLDAGLYRHTPGGRQLLQPGSFYGAQRQPGGQGILLISFDNVDQRSRLQVYGLLPVLTPIFVGEVGESIDSAYWSPDGSRIVFVVRGALGDVTIWAATPDGADVRLVFGEPDVTLSQPQPFTSDGSELALRVTASEGGREELLFFPALDLLDGLVGEPVDTLPGYSSSFSPDGRVILVSRIADTDEQVVDRYVDGLLHDVLGGFEAFDVAWSPDSAYFLSRSFDGAILHTPAAQGQPEALSPFDRVSMVSGVTEDGVGLFIDFEGDLVAIDVATGEQIELDGVGGLSDAVILGG